MKTFLRTVQAEMRKQHRNYFHSWTIYVSLFLWPFLNFIATYYNFKNFDLDKSAAPYITAQNIVAYLMLGYIAMSFFRSLVQSAWGFSREREMGTLELIYLSPASRQGVLLGNAVSSFFEGVAVMAIFGALVLVFCQEALRATLLPCIAVLMLTMIMATLWGMFLNALFLYSRDTRILFTLLEEPMELFAGVTTPPTLFPTWAKAVSAIFPLTYAIDALRRVFLAGAGLAEIKGFLYVGIGIIIGLYLFTLVAIRVAENHSRRTGNYTLF